MEQLISTAGLVRVLLEFQPIFEESDEQDSRVWDAITAEIFRREPSIEEWAEDVYETGEFTGIDADVDACVWWMALEVA